MLRRHSSVSAGGSPSVRPDTATFRAAGITRRGLLASTLALPAAVPAAAGLFTAGGERLRVGVVGCGGRGTGAALLAAAADPAVRVVALGDLFPEQVASAAGMLAGPLGGRFDCPADRRFAGADACRRVVDAGIDMVILAGPPHVRPLHLEAAVAAGLHVYCEKPVAVDLAGLVRAAAAVARGRAAGLALASGLCFRHDPRTAAVAARLHDGLVGRLLAVQVHATCGLPWRKPPRPAGGDRDWRLRNWISFAEYSGGHLVEHHVEAIDRGLWMLGDPTPDQVEGGLGEAGPDTGAIGDCPPLTTARYRFADGRVLEASIERRSGAEWVRQETAIGTRGSCDLVAGVAAGSPLDLPGAGPRRFAAVMEGLVGGILAGRPVAEGEPLLRSTRAAVLGRIAAESGRPVPWDAAAPDASPSTRPV